MMVSILPDPSGMSTHLINLESISFHEIYECFRHAFADYYMDTGSVSEQVLLERARKNGFDPALSVGARRRGTLVGFVLIGRGEWRGEQAAFDVATGVLPDERGQGLAARMFEAVEQEMQSRGIGRCVLEVLEQNTAAIQAYRKVGFNETRRFDCFRRESGVIRGAQKSLPLRIQSLERPHARELSRHWDFQPSWENSLESIERSAPETVNLGVFEGAQCIGELSCHTSLRWVMSLTVHRQHRRRGIGTELLDALTTATAASSLKVINVERANRTMCAFLERAGFEAYASQLEMEYRLD